MSHDNPNPDRPEHPDVIAYQVKELKENVRGLTSMLREEFRELRESIEKQFTQRDRELASLRKEAADNKSRLDRMDGMNRVFWVLFVAIIGAVTKLLIG